MLKVDENLDDLAEILGGEPLDKRLAYFFRKKLVEGFLKGRVDDCWVLEVVI